MVVGNICSSGVFGVTLIFKNDDDDNDDDDDFDDADVDDENENEYDANYIFRLIWEPSILSLG